MRVRLIERAERQTPMMIIISLVGNSVAACKSHDTAIKQLCEMVMRELNQHVHKALDYGDARKSLPVRTVYVELNEQ
jgi:hypothetical protein